MDRPRFDEVISLQMYLPLHKLYAYVPWQRKSPDILRLVQCQRPGESKGMIQNHTTETSDRRTHGLIVKIEVWRHILR